MLQGKREGVVSRQDWHVDQSDRNVRFSLITPDSWSMVYFFYFLHFIYNSNELFLRRR